jgi:hypothetical protein
MLETVEYCKIENYLPISLEGIYKGDSQTLNNLEINIKNIIDVEAPLTLNTLKARLREAFGVKKISQKALDIIFPIIKKLEVVETKNLYDVVYWPLGKDFEIKALRVNSNRQIYDIPHQELKLLVKDLNTSGEELYRGILAYFGYEVLTEKARVYLEFIEDICK